MEITHHFVLLKAHFFFFAFKSGPRIEKLLLPRNNLEPKEVS